MSARRATSLALANALALAAASISAPAQAPRKARAAAPAPAASASVVISGVLLRPRVEQPPTDAVRYVFVRAAGGTRKIAIRLDAAAGGPATTVSRAGQTLSRDKAVDALSLAGLAVDVVCAAAPESPTEPALATRVEIGEFHMPNDTTGIPADLVTEEIEIGDGAEAVPGQTVSVHYTGWLRDGTKFDSSKDRGTPFQFRLGGGQVIRGWDVGVAGMKVGGKRRLVIPPDLGYGARGAGGVIPPNSVLVFEVELLAVK